MMFACCNGAHPDGMHFDHVRSLEQMHALFSMNDEKASFQTIQVQGGLRSARVSRELSLAEHINWLYLEICCLKQICLCSFLFVFLLDPRIICTS